MTKRIIGFIGAGNMGGALARAVRRQLPRAALLISNRRPETAKALAQELSGEAVTNQEAARRCGVLFLGVKPHVIPEVLEELGAVLCKREEPPVLTSMAAGVPLTQLEELAPGCPIIRILPNTPVAIGRGITLYTCGQGATQETSELLAALLAGSGSLVEIPEAQMDAAGVVAGCGPAFVDLFLEAVADGGVYCGLPRELAMRLAAEMTAGAAALALRKGGNPGALKDAVCSPGGSTIRGVRELEQGGLRGAAMNAVIAAWGKE